jgi:uncharacterized YccA/Bax inhibitor family protein
MQSFAEKYPGLIMQAVGLTFGVAIAMFLLYNFRMIKATEKFKSVIMLTQWGIADIFTCLPGLRLFGVNIVFCMITAC